LCDNIPNIALGLSITVRISRRNLLIGGGISLAGILGAGWLYDQFLAMESSNTFTGPNHGIPVIFGSNTLGKICAENVGLTGQIVTGMRIFEAGNTGVSGVVLVSQDAPTDFVMAYYSIGVLGITEFCHGTWKHLLRSEQNWINGELLEIRKTGNQLQLNYRGERVGEPVNTSIEGNIFYPGEYTNNIGSRISGLYYQDSLYSQTRSDKFTMGQYTQGNGVIGLRFNGGYVSDYEMVMKNLSSRYLTAGFAIPRSLINQKKRLTFKQMDEISQAGNEIMCMGKNETPDPVSISEFYEQTLIAQYEMGLLGYEVSSFIQPGTWTKSWPEGYDIRDMDFWSSPEGVEIQKHFLAYETNIEGKAQSMPLQAGAAFGASHLSGDALSGKELCVLVDELIADGEGVEIVFSSDGVGKPGRITKGDFISFLDYLQKNKDKGVLDVLTPTQLLYARAK
jgi:hypothetical protein